MNTLRREAPFWIFFLCLTAIIGNTFQRPELAMWIGFAIAAFSAIGNDSLQTMGTFLTSNAKVKWWILWAFIGGIAVLTHTWGWLVDSGDVAFERLTKIPQAEMFSFWQIFAPAILLILTRYKIPVSTTFLILSVFSNTKTIEAMITKTMYGYVLAFIAAFVFWGGLIKIFGKFFKKQLTKKQEKTWRVIQWFSTAFLWSSWLMQDTANIAVFLPRQLSMLEFIGFMAVVFFLIGLILYQRGGRIQEIIQEKKDVTEVRAATLVDILFAFILVYFKKINSIPMSTTWVFLGLLAGREIVLSHFAGRKNPFKDTAYLVAKDIMLASIGLVVSITLVICARPDEMLPWVKGIFLMGN